MNLNIEYIKNNYKEFEEIIKLMNISSDQLNDLIARKVVPGPSYIINSHIKITSSLNDSCKVIIAEKYFHPGILGLISKHLHHKDAESIKKEFKENMLYNLKNHAHRNFAYENVFDENYNIDDKKIEKIVEEEWNYFCKGIYGICTLNNDVEAIINKEIAIKRLLYFIENKPDLISTDQINELKELNEEFNKSTSLFAPYQRESSSRGKYLDLLLREFSLDDLIQKY